MTADRLIGPGVDRDLAEQLAVAVHVHRAHLSRHGLAEHPALRRLETEALSVARGEVRSGAITRRVVSEDDSHGREYLSPQQAAQIAGVGIATVRRWLRSSALPSSKCGHLRRIRRCDLDAFLSHDGATAAIGG